MYLHIGGLVTIGPNYTFDHFTIMIRNRKAKETVGESNLKVREDGVGFRI